MDVGSFVLGSDTGFDGHWTCGTESYNRMRAAKLDLWNYTQDSSAGRRFVSARGTQHFALNGAAQDITGKGEIRTLPSVDGVIGNVVELTPLYRARSRRLSERSEVPR
jgi:hypothetical protein